MEKDYDTRVIVKTYERVGVFKDRKLVKKLIEAYKSQPEIADAIKEKAEKYGMQKRS